MRLWRKLRNGVYFVDFILVIAAVVAMIGLATFVRLRGNEAPKETGLKGSLALRNGYMEPLSLDENAASKNKSGQQIGPADCGSAKRLQSAITAPEAHSNSSSCNSSSDTLPVNTSSEITVTPGPKEVIKPVEGPPKQCDEPLKQNGNELLNNNSVSNKCLN